MLRLACMILVLLQLGPATAAPDLRNAEHHPSHHARCQAKAPTAPKGAQRSDRKFTGQWGVEHNGWSFIITLKQLGSKLTCNHSLIWANGNRIDDSEPGDGAPSITGHISGKKATISFTSSRGLNAGGIAVITLVGNQLRWRKIKSHGVENFPERATLTRD